MLEVQGRELESTPTDRAVAKIDLQGHLPASLLAYGREGLSV